MKKTCKSCRMKKTCKTCGEEFETLYALRKHQFRAHQTDILPMYQCASCFQSFRSLTQFHQHVVTHKPGYDNNHKRRFLYCDICRSFFFDASALRDHSISLHPNNIILKVNPSCSKCEPRSNEDNEVTVRRLRKRNKRI